MNDFYQGSSRKYRPKQFSQVAEQRAVVTTLKNALALDRIGNCYLFCGPHGTGKTTLARLFAKGANCAKRKEEGEPCGVCQSCSEIDRGTSLDVLEIDGASNRGIEEMKEITETVGYAPSCGRFKVYIIDEVHMLTKEAFNALLKTLEEPPAHVLFLFATTEPHKVVETVLSRCQRFDLHRITQKAIRSKLERIARDREISVEGEALERISARAEGSLRDAEILFDQMSCFCAPPITDKKVMEHLGLAPLDLFFQFDEAFTNRDLGFAFGFSEKLFLSGIHLRSFFEGLIEHYRRIAAIQLGYRGDLFSYLPQAQIDLYNRAAQHYTKRQCMDLLELLIREGEVIQRRGIRRIHLEVLFFRMLRLSQKMPLEELVERLEELQKKVRSPLEAFPVEQEVKKETACKIEESIEAISPPSSTISMRSPREIEGQETKMEKKIHRDRLIQFAAVELKGHLIKE